jgi:GR25 family glycosyltransferase involved in LPS biosynthesis
MAWNSKRYNTILKMLLVLFTVLSIYVLYVYVNTSSSLNRQKENMEEGHQSVVISLPYRPERLDMFRKHYDLPIAFTVEDAYDGINADLDQLRKEQTISDRVYQNIIDVDKGKNKDRIKDYVSRGGIGCYLSHVNIWKKMQSIGNDNYLFVFEDDAQIQEIPMKEIQERVKEVPDDWHIYILGSPHTIIIHDWIDNKEEVAKLTQFCGTHAYIINKRGIEWLLNNSELFPIEKQVDFKLSEYCKKGLNVYYHPNKQMYFVDENAGTDIQL